MIEAEWTSRTELLLKKEKLDKLKNAHVLIVGLGGVGGYAAEQIARSGVGALTLVDCDTIHPSNINRQIIATKSTVGQEKTQVLSSRLKDINPEIKIIPQNIFIDEESVYHILDWGFDYVIDAIDTLTPKVDLLEACIKTNTKVVSSMGSGGRMDPTAICIGDIEESNHCKFAFFVRKHLHKRGIYSGIKVVYSPERVPSEAIIETDGKNNKKTIVGTISYMPALFGCNCAAIVIRDLIEQK